MFVQNPLSGYIVYTDQVNLRDPETYLEHIRQIARRYLEQELWGALYDYEVTHPMQIVWLCITILGLGQQYIKRL